MPVEIYRPHLFCVMSRLIVVLKCRKWREKLVIFKYFCNFALSHAEDAQERAAWGGIVHTKRRLLRFGFDGLRTSQLQKTVSQKQSNVNAPGMCLYAVLLMLCSHRCILTPWNYVESIVSIYISAWGYALLVSTYRAMRRPLNREASDSAGLHAFFMSLL